MKTGSTWLMRSAICAVLALSMLLCIAFPAVAAIDLDHDHNDKINYVAIGDSKPNGFGLPGHFPDEFYQNPANKVESELHGYKSEAENAYPSLLSQALAEMTGKPVKLEQLGMTYMRVEELRVLLDNDYYGDSYTEWRFTGEENWFNAAHEGGLAGLRAEYQSSIANADFITVDIGINNFTTYAFNRILYENFDADFSCFTEKTQNDLAWIRSTISSLAFDLLGSHPGSDEIINNTVDTLTYAAIGFCANFDACMTRIYELNPDATVVVVNLQNPMKGLSAKVPGIEDPVPFGDLYGYIMNIANLYTAAMSPYSDRYCYAYMGDDGVAETFLDELKGYTGNPEDLSTEITDCFDVYDDTMLLKTRALWAMTQTMSAAALVSIKDGYTTVSLSDISDVAKFGTAVYDNALLFDGVDVKTFLEKGAKNQLSATLQPAYNKYRSTLLRAYDAIATLMQLGANTETMDFAAAVADFGSAAEKVLTAFSSILALSMQNENFNIEESDEFKALAADPAGLAMIALGVRANLVDGFFTHPSKAGHREMCDTIINALLKEITSFLAKDEESFYIALGDGVASGKKSYVANVAKGLGIDYKNLAGAKLTVEDGIASVISNADLFKKADLVTIDYSSAAVTEFMFAEMDAAISGKKPTELNWNGLLGAADAYVQMALAEVRNILVNQNLDVDFMGLNLADLLMRGIEGYAYAYAMRMLRYGELIDTVADYAPDALIVLVGSYNDFNDITFTMEGITLDISEYIEYVVTSLNTEARLYAAIQQARVIYVDAPEVETVFASDILSGEYSNITLMTYLNAVKRGELRPTANGHKYISDRILEEIPLHTHTYKSDCATECETCVQKRVGTAEHTYEHACFDRCKVCGEKRAEIGAHDFGDWTVTKPATETETGIKTRACKACGHEEAETLPMVIPSVTTPDTTTPNTTAPTITTTTPNDSTPQQGGGCGGITVAAQLIALICAAAAFISIKKK